MDLNLNVGELVTKHKSKIVNVVIFCGLLYFASGIYKKQTAKINSLVEKKEIEIQKNGVFKEISQLQAVIANYRAFFNNKDISQEADTISSLAAACSVKILSFKPLAEENFSVYRKYPFDLKIETEDYHKLGKFVAKLESHPHFFNVDSAKITSPAGERGKSRLNANLEISTIFLKD